MPAPMATMPPAMPATIQPIDVWVPSAAAMPPPSSRNGQMKFWICKNLGSFSALRATSSSSIWARSARRRDSGSSPVGGAGAAAGSSPSVVVSLSGGGATTGSAARAARIVASSSGVAMASRPHRLSRMLRLLLPVEQHLDRGPPVGLGHAPALDRLVATSLEDGERVPAGLLLGLLGPPLLLLELVVELLLGLGERGVARLRIALIGLEDRLARPRVLGLQGPQLIVELVGELLRRRLVLLLLPVDPSAESRLDLRLFLGPGRDQGFQVVQRTGLDLDKW